MGRHRTKTPEPGKPVPSTFTLPWSLYQRLQNAKEKWGGSFINLARICRDAVAKALDDIESGCWSGHAQQPDLFEVRRRLEGLEEKVFGKSKSFRVNAILPESPPAEPEKIVEDEHPKQHRPHKLRRGKRK